MQQPSLSLEDFARDVVGKPLYEYQLKIANAILESIFAQEGRIFTVMLARQSGKNQISAMLEAYLLASLPAGTIVKAAPTYKPQIVHSRLRLLSLLEESSLRPRVWKGQGYLIGLAPKTNRQGRTPQTGPRVMFLSAAPESNVVGATADLLLEIDEAQDVTHEKFDRDFRPMASTTNATTVLYGTAWTETTLLARQRAFNLDLELRTNRQQHFEHDWRSLAAINPHYRQYVEQEIERLGEDHIAIQTQYFLRPLSEEDAFFNELERLLLQGSHSWEDGPRDEDYYIAGLDVAGEERSNLPTDNATAGGRTRRDSTVLTIGRVRYNELGLAMVEVVHHEWWTGWSVDEQYHATVALAEHWGLRRLVVDMTGLGQGLTSMLEKRLGEQRVSGFTFSRPGKSRLAYALLNLVKGGRLKLYAAEHAPRRIFEECQKQLRQTRRHLYPSNLIDFYVTPTDGHDDFVSSLALLAEAVEDVAPEPASATIRPPRLYPNESRY